MVGGGIGGIQASLDLAESGFKARALSRKRASGMWQFMSGTARLYGMRVDWSVDERRDPFKSTDAAVAFLQAEEEKFRETYHTGIQLLENEIAKLDGAKQLSGETAFILYDSHGFPLELSQEICAEQGLTVDREGKPFPLEQFEFVIRVNLIGSFNCLRLAAAEMSKNEASRPPKLAGRLLLIKPVITSTVGFCVARTK